MKKIMKYIITYVLIILSYSSLLSQEYHKLITNSKSWDESYAEMGYICSGFSDYPPIRFMVSGDTSINDLNYTKFSYQLMTPTWGSPPPNCPPFMVDTIKQEYLYSFLREDTITQRLWIYKTYNDTEELLYDFSLDKGDTLYHAILNPTIIDTVYEIVTSDGISRKKLELEGGYHSGGFYIEGLGGVAGLFERPYYYFEMGSWMMCVKDNEIIVWEDSYHCYDLITGNDNDNAASQIKVYPNPTRDLIKINGADLSAKFKIYNTLGECFIDSELKGQNTIDLNCLINGVYYLQIEHEDKIISEIIIKNNGL